MVNTNMPGTEIIWVEKCEYRDVGVKRHTHSYYQLYYLYSGSCTFISEDNEYYLDKGFGIFISPGIAHGIKRVENSTAVLREIKFFVEDESLCQDLINLNKPVRFDDYASDSVEYLINYGRSRLSYYIDSCQCCMNSLIFYLSRENRIINQADLNSQLIDTTGFSDLSVKIIIYLEEEYASQITLDALAEEMGYSKNYICNVFRKDTGFTIINYLNFIRIRHAAEMFSYSDREISYICETVGFKNMSHFVHTFKRFVGIPPGLYRRVFPADINKHMSDASTLPHLVSDQLETIANRFGTLPDDS